MKSGILRFQMLWQNGNHKSLRTGPGRPVTMDVTTVTVVTLWHSYKLLSPGNNLNLSHCQLEWRCQRVPVCTTSS